MEHLLCEPTVGGECNVCGMKFLALILNSILSLFILRYKQVFNDAKSTCPMKKILYFLFVSLFFISCSTDNEGSASPIDDEPIVADGKQVFRIDLKELSAKTVLSNQKKLEPAFALVSINDSDGVPILTREKIVLGKKSDSYITNEISLEVGDYSLIEFIVTDENDVVIAVAPKENSVLAQFSNSPLPYNFEVSENETKETVTENINAGGYTSVDFGYTGLTLIFPENINSFSLTVDDSELLTIKTLTLKSLTGSTYKVDWGDGLVEDYLTAQTDAEEANKLTHTYEQQDSYTISISGPIEAIEYFSFHGEIPNEIYQYQNNLVSVDIGKLKLLNELFINTGKLSSLDCSNNTRLEKLTVFGNNLTNLDLTNNFDLIEASLFDNELTRLDISQNLNLENLNVGENQLTNLDITSNTDLQILTANKNALQTLDITSNSKLHYLNLSGNSLTNFDSSGNLNLVTLSMGFNQLTSVDVSKNTQLKNLDVNENQLSSLDLSNNPQLETLHANDNLLTDLNTLNNAQLRYLVLANNDLTSLDLSNNSSISILQIANNQFNGVELDQVIAQLYDFAVLNSIVKGTLWYNDNPGTENINESTVTKLNDLATSYEWNIYGN